MYTEQLFDSLTASSTAPIYGSDIAPHLRKIIDNFAGGGGASEGIRQALGRSPDYALNHSKPALALHEVNHPETIHLSENIYKVDPLDHLAGEHIGLGWFSPDCKHFSKAKGGKPVERNIRDLAWTIVHWVERIQKSGGKLDVIIMENVEEFQYWGPLVETERGLMPDPERKGETFQKWCKELRKLGGKIQKRELRACDYGAPTIRKRLFVIIRFDGLKIVWPKSTHGAPTDGDVIAGRKLPWRTAAEIIDWSLPCPSIFDTSDEILARYGLRAIRPLAHNTMARVARGLRRYVLDALRPFIVGLAHGGSSGRREYGLSEPLTTVHAGGNNQAVVAPSVVRFNTGATGQDAREPLSTVTANGFIKRPGGAAPLGIMAPHLMTMRNSGKPYNGADEPTHTITAGGAGLSIVAPTLVQTGYGEREGQQPRSLDIGKPLGTAVAGGIKHAVATAFVAQHNNDSRREGGVNPGRDARDPLSTATATGAQQGVVAAFISRQFGTSTGHEAHAPLATTTADGGGKSMLVAPHLHAYYGVDQDTPEDEPFHTLTTKPRFSHIEARIDAPPFTEDQADRARMVADFMREHGLWDEREFVTVEIDGVTFVIVDIGMRMLTPRELYNAQGFPRNYVIDRDADGKLFSKSVQVSCVGNSVSPPVAAALVAANCNHMAVPERMAA
jgi:DNA (cytosine-5)-methyltransferase 1